MAQQMQEKSSLSSSLGCKIGVPSGCPMGLAHTHIYRSKLFCKSNCFSDGVVLTNQGFSLCFWGEGKTSGVAFLKHMANAGSFTRGSFLKHMVHNERVVILRWSASLALPCIAWPCPLICPCSSRVSQCPWEMG